MLWSYLVHQHGVQETIQKHDEAGSNASMDGHSLLFRARDLS